MDDLIPLIPSAWLAAAHEYAPAVLGALAVTTVLVRLLLPLARQVETWAAASSARWDDEPARQAVAVLEWLAGASAALLAMVPRLTVGEPGRAQVPRVTTIEDDEKESER